MLLAILLPAPAIIVTTLIIVYAEHLEIPFANGRVGDGSDSNVSLKGPEINITEQDAVGEADNKGEHEL